MLLAVSVLLLAACAAPPAAARSAAPPVLVNRTANALIYAAFDLEEAALVDPAPAMDPASARDRTVPAGAEAPIAYEETSGEGVLLFLYEVPAGNPAGSVPLGRTVRVTRAELQASHGRIVIGPE